jgi:hypothetical protein
MQRKANEMNDMIRKESQARAEEEEEEEEEDDEDKKMTE